MIYELVNSTRRLGAKWKRIGLAGGAIVAVLLASVGQGLVTPASADVAVASLWSDSVTPKVVNQSDSASVELGVKFKSSQAGSISGIKFYKGVKNTGTHTGSLWDSKGKLLAQATFSNETSSGWQTVLFAQPVAITADTTYVASYHAPRGQFSIDSRYFAKDAYSNGPLTALKSTSNSANGVYVYSSQVKFPSGASNADNYWVDVVFSTGTDSPPSAPVAPNNVSATQVGNAITVAWNASTSQNLSSYLVFRNDVQVASVNSTVQQYNDTDVTDGTTYSYTIRAVGASGLSSPASQPATVTYTATQTPPSSGRVYPLHTNINATTFWVGEQFQSTADGSQVCSAYDSQWQYSYFRLKTGTNTAPGCKGAPTGGCDAKLSNPNGKCNDTNSIGSLRTPQNGYWPAGLPQIYENPFYLDLPYDDYNASTSSEKTGYATRCNDIPWANDPGYVGHCKDQSFSYMKNRFVKVMANGAICYGQIEDAGPADSGNGNGNYADANYVFSSADARPYNKSYNSAGMDVSPALNACLGGRFNEDLSVSWQFVDAVDVPDGPWKVIVTTTAPN